MKLPGLRSELKNGLEQQVAAKFMIEIPLPYLYHCKKLTENGKIRFIFGSTYRN